MGEEASMNATHFRIPIVSTHVRNVTDPIVTPVGEVIKNVVHLKTQSKFGHSSLLFFATSCSSRNLQNFRVGLSRSKIRALALYGHILILLSEKVSHTLTGVSHYPLL